jgi:hypothetical protein
MNGTATARADTASGIDILLFIVGG